MEIGSLNLETLKSSLLFNFRTGNVVIDTLITGFIICLSTYLMNLASRIQEIDFRALLEKLFGEKPEPPEILVNKIHISGKKVSGSYSSHYSDTFLALIHRIKKLNCVVAKISELSEIHLDNEQQYSYDSSDDEGEVEEMVKKAELDKTNLIVSQPSPFMIAENVEGVVNNLSNKKDSDNDSGTKNLLPVEEFQIVTISSTVLSMDELRGLLNCWTKEYRASIKPDDYLRYFLYTDEYRDEYSEYRFDSGKSFDNIFFPQKDDIINRINFFTCNKEWYRKRGIPHTIGFMFYGVPGCGKTSTIKAMANYTKRHIVSVPLSKIKSCKELLGIFYNSRINGKYIPLHKRLYVLEDIDCDDLKHIVADRKTKKSASPEDCDSGSNDGTDDGKEKDAQNLLLKGLLKSVNTQGEQDGKKGGIFDIMTNKLTLANILEVLDGVMEMDGRMLVMTTNYPERLDEALIRPGRIDIKIKFDKCTSICLTEMYEQFFEDQNNSKLWPEDFDKSTLPNDRWTPAEAAQILLNNTHKPYQALTHFLTESPKSNYGPKDNSVTSPNTVDGNIANCNPCDVVSNNSVLNVCDDQDMEASNSMTASMLAGTKFYADQEQKQKLGERLFPLIEKMYPCIRELAGKITGMLLELDNSELIHMLEHGESLKGKVDEAVAVLLVHHSTRNEYHVELKRNRSE